MITIDHLHKYYGTPTNRYHVLKDLSLSLPSKNIACLLGPSGSGKSTLLNILGGIETVDEGRVVVENLALETMKKKQLENYRRQYLGFVFQFYNLVQNLTVRENILTGAYLSHAPLELMPLAEQLGIDSQLNKFPNEISGGQAQRVSIARAMIKRPSLLLCDEPTGALDYESAKSVLVLLEELNRTYGTTILLATHNEAIASMCDTVIRLHDGRVKSIEENTEKIAAKAVAW